MIMLPYMPMVCMVAILGAMLQVHGRFGPTAAVPIVLNVCLIAAAVGLSFVFDPGDDQQRIFHIGSVAGAVIVAGVLQVAWSMWALRSRQWWVRDFAPPNVTGLPVLIQSNGRCSGIRHAFTLRSNGPKRSRRLITPAAPCPTRFKTSRK